MSDKKTALHDAWTKYIKAMYHAEVEFHVATDIAMSDYRNKKDDLCTEFDKVVKK